MKIRLPTICIDWKTNIEVRMSLILMILFLTNRYWLLFLILSLGKLILQIILLLTFYLRILHPRKKKFLHDVNRYFWNELYLFRLCADNIIRQCVPEAEMMSILEAYHSSQVGGHHGGNRTAQKVL